jgi:uncharacterized protein with NRDE domain
MCLIALAWKARPDLPLIVAANRDEFFARPTRPAHVWDDAPQVVGGRDLRAGGSWLAVTGGGRFAAITNIRYAQIEGGPSRGALVAGFIKGDESPLVFLERLAAHAHEYAGFHLILGDRSALAHFSNADERPTLIEPGIFGISNASPGVEWPKVAIARQVVASAAFMNDREAIATELLDFLSTSRGVNVEEEIFVSFPDRGYGTRSSTVVIVDQDHSVLFRERNHPEGGEVKAEWSEGRAEWLVVRSSVS